MRRLGRILVFAPLCALSAFMTGCVNQQKETQLWRDVVNAGLTPPAPYVDGTELSLPHAMALANRDNEQIAIRGEDYVQAVITRQRAVAAFLPTLSFQPSFSLEDAPGATAAASPPISGNPAPAAPAAGTFAGSGSTLHRFEAPLVAGASLTPTAFGNLRAADENIVEQRQILLDAQAVLLLDVAQMYFQVLRSEEQVTVLRHTVELEEARFRDVDQKVNKHLALALELLQSRAQAAATRARLTQAENDVQSARKTLAFLLGLTAVNGPLSDTLLVPRDFPEVGEFLLRARASRQDLQAAQSAVRVARAEVDAAIAEYYPSVSLNIAGFLYRENFSIASKWDAILLANLPIFSAGIIEADVRAAWSRLRTAALNESYLSRQIERDVAVAYGNAISASRQLGDLAAAVEASSGALTQAKTQLVNGLAVPLDVLTAQDTLLQAQLAYSGVEFDRDIFYLDLLRATGQLTPQITQDWPTTRPSSRSSPLDLRSSMIVPTTRP